MRLALENERTTYNSNIYCRGKKNKRKVYTPWSDESGQRDHNK